MRKLQCAVCFILLLQLACIKKPSGQVTPWERVTTYNSLLASANNTVAQGVILVNQDKLLDTNLTGEVLAVTNTSALADDQLTSILAKGSAVTTQDLGTVSALLTQISESGQTLIKGGQLGIENPKSKQTIAADLNSIVSIAQQIIQLLPQLRQQPSPPMTGVK